MIQAIGQIGIPVKDITRATEFYKTQLRLPLLFTAGNLSFFDCDGVRLMLTLPESEMFDHPSSVLYFNVSDIQETYGHYKAKGIEFIDEPHVVAEMNGTATWMVFFKDTEGNIHAFMSEQPV